MKTYSKEPGAERAETIFCPLCGSTIEKHLMLYDFKSYSFRKCSVCSLVFQNPQPVFHDLSGRYDEEYFKYEIENEESFFSLMKLALDDIEFDKISFPAEPKKKSIIDVGCATGRFLEHFRQKGWEVAGVEICTAAAGYGNRVRNVNIRNCTLEKAGFPDKSATVVHASHLIEHLNDPVSFLAEAGRILSDNGYLILVTPNIAGFQSILFRSSWRSLIADHLLLYSGPTLEKLCTEQGFELLRKKTWGGLARGTAPVFVKKIIDKMAKKGGFGDVMIMLFKKRECP